MKMRDKNSILRTEIHAYQNRDRVMMLVMMLVVIFAIRFVSLGGAKLGLCEGKIRGF